MSTAFVAGATGYTGREVVACLIRRGVKPIAHVRPDSPRAPEWRSHFGSMGAIVDHTPWEAAAMRETLLAHGPAAIFALLGTTRRREKETGGASSYEAVDIGLTLLLLDAARVVTPRPRFVYLSAAGVRDDARGAYLKARATVEARVRESDLPYTIARPSFITGPDREEHRTGERVAAATVDAGLKVLSAFGARRLRARWSSTTGPLLAEALVRAALDPSAAGRVLESEQLRAAG